MSALLRNNKLSKKILPFVQRIIPPLPHQNNTFKSKRHLIQRSQRDLYEKPTLIPLIRVPEQSVLVTFTIYWDCTSRLAGQHFGFKSAYWFSDNLHATSNWAGTRDEPLRTSAGEGDKIFFSPKYTIKIFKYVFFFVTAKIPGAVDNVTGRQGDGWEEYYFLVSPYVFSFLRERGGGGGGLGWV